MEQTVEIKHINPEDFEKRINKEVQIIDLRSYSEISGQTIGDAEAAPFGSVTFDEVLNRLDSDKPLYIYCMKGGWCIKAMPHIQNLGYRSVVILDGGVENWIASGRSLNNNPKVFWNNMYASEDYVYGIDPNAYFKQTLDNLPKGKLLLPAEGEGRNAVYAAKCGWEVDAFDISIEGQEKALKLAEKNNVKVNYSIGDFADPPVTQGYYDTVALIYSHVPSAMRFQGMPKIMDSLKLGGTVIIEVFSPEHTRKGVDFGPGNPDMTIDKAELHDTFSNYSIVRLVEETVMLNDGRHQGEGVVTRMIAIKVKSEIMT